METIRADIAVIGGGPGGYTAAFCAAAKGRKVVLVDREERLGGVCLNWGCIPSKALLHVAKLIREAREAEPWGIEFPKPTIHLSKLRAWKASVVEKLTLGLAGLAGRRNVTVIRGVARFQGPKSLEVNGQSIAFDHAIIATGSAPVRPKVFHIHDKRVMTSTEALEIEEVPGRLLVVGGGYIGMELGTVYAALGSQVVVVEALGRILWGADPDLVRFVHERAMRTFSEIRLNTRVLELRPEHPAGIRVIMEFEGLRKEEVFDKVLVAVGREPVTEGLDLEAIKVAVGERGFIRVDKNHATSVPHVYAIGDVAGGMLLAHKAARDAKAVVDHLVHAAGHEDHVIPAVVFTDPELAWCGLTEEEARAGQIPVQVVKFPWMASGKASAMDRTDGVTKLLIDPRSEKVLGVGICGVGAGELIGEAALALQAGLRVKDLAHGVRPHPTLSETLTECAEMFFGCSVNAYSRKRN
ncbi:MAG: dihydrolipoyl dehydrogenase [Candidatus Omnitrophica bacterium]|nr:dihydrolipoyl dehydrogenase [Candidatus Omnitrophota bacterium]